jgi:hypothetical protein
MTNTTTADLQRALASHVETLASVGITYEGHLGLEEGSKTYGRAYRLYRTGQMVSDDNGGERPATGHYSPPIGDDYLGMTKGEAYKALTSRTRAIADTVYALQQSGRLS